MLFFSVCLILLGLFKLSLAFSPFGFQGFWSSLLLLFWILFQVAAYFLFIYLGLCFPSLFLHLCSISLPFYAFFFFFNLFCLRSHFPRLQGKLNSFLEEGWILSFFWFLPSKVWSSGLWISYRVRFVLSFFSDVQGWVRWYSGCWWLGLHFCFVCCLDEVSCTGCYWWLVDAASYFQVVSFVWVLTIWYSRGLVLW